MNELKLTYVELFAFFHIKNVPANASELFFMAHLRNNERFLYHSNLSLNIKFYMHANSPAWADENELFLISLFPIRHYASHLHDFPKLNVVHAIKEQVLRGSGLFHIFFFRLILQFIITWLATFWLYAYGNLAQCVLHFNSEIE